MASNSSTLVISIAIGILLLLILLLLLSYNSKAKSDKVERFEDDEEEEKFYGGSYNNNFKGYQEFTNDINDEAYLNTSAKDRLNIRRNKAAQISLFTDYDSMVKVESSEKEKEKYTNNREEFTNMNGASINDSYSLLGNNSSADPSTCFKRDRLSASDLLPSDASSKWAQINPSSSGELSDQNFLTAGYHVGINTVGQSMRNANLQLRSEIPNPQVAVSPWLISTIEPDVRAVSFEIGSAPQTPPV